MHVLLNMWFLWLFGDNVEDRLGPLLYLVLYLVGGLIASGAHWAVEPESTMPVIGASGAIAAVLGAYAVTWPWARVSTLVFLVVFVTSSTFPRWWCSACGSSSRYCRARSRCARPRAAGWPGGRTSAAFLAGMALMPLLSAMVDGARNDGEDTIAN